MGRVAFLAGSGILSACAGSKAPIVLPAPRYSLESEPMPTEHAVALDPRATTKVTGDVRFLDSPEGIPDLGPVVVYLVPHDPGPATRSPETRTPLVITSHGTAFDPDLTAVGRGRQVVFANEGSLSHTLFSADLAGARFELPPGTRTRGIDLPPRGPIRFYCSLHADESFVVFSASTEYLAVVEGRSTYSMGPVEAGSYTLSIWSERVSGPVREIAVDGYSRALEPIWIDPALVRRRTPGREGSP